MRQIKRILLTCLMLCVLAVVPTGQAKADGTRLFDIIVKDGYTTQKIEMKYGETPYGYTSYYANRSVIYVNAKAKNVSFSIRKNTSSRYGNFTFASPVMKPETEPKGNLFRYTVDGKTRAWMFTVQKLVEPEVKKVKLICKKTEGAYLPAKNKAITIKTNIQAQVPIKIEIRVLNQAGKTVFLKELGESQSKSYVYKWNGKPSKNNSAKLSTRKFAPAGEYRVRVIAIPQIGGRRQEFYKEEKILFGEK